MQMWYFEYSVLFKSGFDLSNFMFGHDVCKNNIAFGLCTVWSSRSSIVKCKCDILNITVYYLGYEMCCIKYM